MKKVMIAILTIIVLITLYFTCFYKSTIRNVIDYKKYKYYDEEYINKYSGKILKSYEEYKEFVGNQEILINQKDFEKSYYAIIFVFDSCSSKYLGIKSIDYGNPKYNESISILAKIKDFGGEKCNDQKIVLVPIPKDKAINQDKVIYSFVGI